MTEAFVTENLEHATTYPAFEFEIMGGVLDVGCGLHPRGDVNVDLYIDSRQRRADSI